MTSFPEKLDTFPEKLDILCLCGVINNADENEDEDENCHPDGNQRPIAKVCASEQNASLLAIFQRAQPKLGEANN